MGIEQRRQRERDARRKAVLDAARGLVRQHGFNGTTTRQIHDPLTVGDPQVSDTHVTWWGDNGTDQDIFIYDIAAGTTTNL
ncbi:hypothetical protein LCGC14_2017960, partial [marine sediment metagenome]